MYESSHADFIESDAVETIQSNSITHPVGM